MNSKQSILSLRVFWYKGILILFMTVFKGRIDTLKKRIRACIF